DPPQGRNMGNGRVLVLPDVMQTGSGGNDRMVQPLHSESLEGMGIEMGQQRFPGIIFPEIPFVQKIGIETLPEMLDEVLAFVSLKNNLGGLEALQQLVNVGVIAFGSQKFTGGNIQKSHPGLVFSKMDSRQV